MKKYPLNKLDNYFLRYNKITENMEYELFDIYAKDLITVYRIDLVAKYYYIECRQKNQNLDFAKELYEKHIDAFTDGTFKEAGNANKNSIEKYIEMFENLIDDIKESGYNSNISIIPIGKNYELLDGSHRVACAAYFNQKIKVIRFPNISVDYGLKFFKRRLLDDYYLDFIAKEYASIKDNIYLLSLYPKISKAKKIKFVDEILEEKQGKVIYNKKIKLKKEELKNIVFRIYKDENWIGHNKNNFKESTREIELCYNKNRYLDIYIINGPSIESLLMARDEIINLLGIEKSLVHITETKEETIDKLQLVLDRNCNQHNHSSFQQNIKSRNNLIRCFLKKIRYAYRIIINNIKCFLGKPV